MINYGYISCIGHHFTIFSKENDLTMYDYYTCMYICIHLFCCYGIHLVAKEQTLNLKEKVNK